MTNIEKKFMILDYNNRESVAMTAILNKKIPPMGFSGTFHQGV